MLVLVIVLDSSSRVTSQMGRRIAILLAAFAGIVSLAISGAEWFVSHYVRISFPSAERYQDWIWMFDDLHGWSHIAALCFLGVGMLVAFFVGRDILMVAPGGMRRISACAVSFISAVILIVFLRVVYEVCFVESSWIEEGSDGVWSVTCGVRRNWSWLPAIIGTISLLTAWRMWARFPTGVLADRL